VARPKKLHYPINFDRLLVLLMPKIRPEHRPRFYRLLLRDNYYEIKMRELGSHQEVINDQIRRGIIDKPLPDSEIESLYQGHSKKLFSQDEASLFSAGIGLGREKWKRDNIQARMKKLARASWTPDARENRRKRKATRKKSLKKKSASRIKKRVSRIK
jgi:hypothetical protein